MASLEPRREVIDVEGIPTHLFRGGEGPPLLYLHGLAPVGEWLPVHQELARNFTVYAPDHPGFGDTERPEWCDTMGDLVLHYDALLRTLAPGRPAVVGFSFGGWIAAELAVAYPERFGALVLLNAAGLHVEGALMPDLAALPREELARTIFHSSRAASEYFAARLEPDQRLRSYRAMATAALLAWNPWFNPKLPQRLGRVRARTLALWAEHDRLFPPVYAEAYRDAIPDAELEIIPDCGHMAPLERPEAVASAIRRFVLPGEA